MLEVDGQRVITLFGHELADERTRNREKAIHNGLPLPPQLLDLVLLHRGASYWICLARDVKGPAYSTSDQARRYLLITSKSGLNPRPAS
ncbi:hypothetical protein D9M68_709000 [compost metagenome]